MIDAAYLRDRFKSSLMDDQVPVAVPTDYLTSNFLRQAAVLMPIIYPASAQGSHCGEGFPAVLFTRRTSHLKHHAGQISFPGGSVEAFDPHRVATALRETQEEVGIAKQAIEVIGLLPDYQTSTGFNITPVIGLLEQGFQWQSQPEEVEEVFTVPLAFLMSPGNHHWHSAQEHLPNGRLSMSPWLSMDYQKGKQVYQIWGATAGILLSFYHFL